VVEKFGYAEADVKEWLDAVEYPEDCAEVSWKVITDTLRVLQQAGAVAPSEGDAKREQFLNMDVVTLA